MRILLLEDDKLPADALSRAMGQSAYAVDVADTGEQADSALVAQACDLVILDIGLPGASITLEEDKDGVGNTFSVYFPACGSGASAPGRPAP